MKARNGVSVFPYFFGISSSLISSSPGLDDGLPPGRATRL